MKALPHRRLLVGALGVDCLVLALVLPQALGHPVTVSATLIDVLVVFLALCYCAVDVLGSLRPRGADLRRRAAPIINAATPRRATGGRGYQLKLVLLAALVALVVVLPTVVAIGARREGPPQRYIGDSALQVEENAAFLLQGTDYYARTFFGTPLAQWWPVGSPNPALYHADELPTEVVLAAALSLPFRAVFGWFDVRLLYLLAYCAMLGFALVLARGPAVRLALVAGLALNPLFVPGIISGNDDVLVVAELLAVVACARRGWTRAALVLLGVACATKYTALPLVPFFLLYLAGQQHEAPGQAVGAGTKDVRGWLTWLAAALGWVALPLAVLVGPFLIWNARAFVDSTIGFIEGTVAHSFPIRGPEGYGFGTFVLQGGLVHSPQAYFPFGLFQLAVAVPLLWVLLRRQWRHNALERALAGYATLFLAVSYFARFFHGSHLAYGVALFLLAFFLPARQAVFPAPPVPGVAPSGLSPDGALPNVRQGESQDESQGGTHVRLDFLVLLLLVPQVLARPVGRAEQITAAAALLLLIAYAIVAAFAGSPAQRALRRQSAVLPEPDEAAARDVEQLEGHDEAVLRLANGSRRGRVPVSGRASRFQTVLLLLLIGLLTLWPSVYGTLARHHSKPFDYVTDNAMQVEYAAGFLLSGKNPYAETYIHTPMVHWYGSPAMDQALYHADEMPLNFLLTVPLLALARTTLGWFDERFLLLPLLAVIIWLAWRWGGSPEERRARLAALVLGPFFVPSIIYGDTDLVIVAALIGAFVAVHARRLGLAALLIGAALAAKQTAVFLYPLFLAYLWGLAPPDASRAEKLRFVWRHGRWLLLVPALTLGPFLVWNAPALWAGTVGFVAGTVPHSYPIRGIGAFGFGAVVLLGRLVSSPESYFPFTAIELLIAGPLLVILCWALAKRPHLPLLVSTYAVVMGFGYFFSRFLQDTNMGYVLLVVALACLVPRARTTATPLSGEPVERETASGGPRPILQTHSTAMTR
jgi:hypothetical protein